MAFMVLFDSFRVKWDSSAPDPGSCATQGISRWINHCAFYIAWSYRLLFATLARPCTAEVLRARAALRSRAMAEKVPQTLANHVRFDPLFHFFLVPIFGLSTIAAVVLFIWHPSLDSAWRFVLIAAGKVALFNIR